MKLNKYLWMAGLGLMALLQGGCLKKADTYADELLYSDKSSLIELRRADRQRLPSLTAPAPIPYAPTPAEESLLLGYVRLASAEVSNSAITVRLKVSTTGLPAGYVALPANAYSFVTPLDNITIPAKSRFVEVRAVIKKQLLDPAVHYAIRLEIDDPGAGNKISQRSQMMMVAPEPE